MKLCKRCTFQKYCSVDCQTKDWPRHKPNCVKRETIKNCHTKCPVDLKTSPICANCRRENSFLQCIHCSRVYYCSQLCQKKDWTKHKTFCKVHKFKEKNETLSAIECSQLGLVTPEEHRGRNPNDSKCSLSPEWMSGEYFNNFTCNHCENNTCKTSCPLCKAVFYCSETCRNLDEPNHKKNCDYFQFYEMTIYDRDISFRCVSSNPNSIYSPKHAFFDHMKNPMLVRDGADLTLIVERTPESVKTAVEKSKELFPAFSLITRLREIPLEKTTLRESNICTIPNMFLLYIRRFHDYRGRHNVYLQDSDRWEIYVSFYLPNDDPTPYFEWNDLVPGKFIVILFPCIHFFRDETVGIRVDKPKNVKVLDV
ncbi:uncharacterized protein LOC133192400 [Saccostrea echinata]|uniref:uncharacterized protein LOC133192400 n=1 Tax=Saccostrea echinata TaxID=191078 RepID=UPI002A83E647|nr:uncharacterized protein LOC133192400 [Saccostrea echinata]